MNDSPDMLSDLEKSDWFRAKVRDNESYAQNLYAAMCNNRFQKMEPWPVLKDETWGCSWRGAGGIVADLRDDGDYLDWYCSGIMQEGHHIPGFVAEGIVTEEIEHDLNQLGWQVLSDSDQSS